MLKLDILVIAAHPDDAELSCSGTIFAHIAQGKKVGIVDLTQGELGTRGDATTRKQEAEEASRIMQLSIRENLKCRDGFFANDEAHQLAVIKVIRKYQPEIILTNAIRDRHPDHAKASDLVETSAFLAGLKRIETIIEDKLQTPWRPKNIYHFIQSDYINPDIIVDISDFWENKVKAIKAYQTQFYTSSESMKGEQTFISTPEFMNFLEGRAREFGQAIRTKYGEGFTTSKKIGIGSLFDLY
ncbi:MAG: bacillithiol biosynthesis deacetylase BshB1 [Thermoflexibacter sp.]|jgi:bacillithiol biosynthesis deacetylase BshB1|nr:bacillithiol biosynthesis deacetylase BshB1 [Thermoflexibacter sp.]